MKKKVSFQLLVELRRDSAREENEIEKNESEETEDGEVDRVGCMVRRSEMEVCCIEFKWLVS